MTENPEGTKTIKLGIYFWTNLFGNSDPKKVDGVEMPKKTCWDSGFVNIVSNNRHSIRSGNYSNFKNIDDIPRAIREVMKKSDVKVISGEKNKEYKEALKKIKEAELV